jgi:HTH-type transcriptional regulator / antitoxin HigA
MLSEPVVVKPIRSEIDFREAYAMVGQYNLREISGDTLSPDEADHFEVLLTLIQAYESQATNLVAPSPQEAVQFRLEQAQLDVDTLIPIFGTIDIARSFLDGSYKLTITQSGALHRTFGIPLESLVP